MRARRYASTLGVVALGLFAAACAGPRRWSPPSGEMDRVPRLVILLLPGSVDKSLLSPYNDEVPYTPRLGRLAAEALVFDNHVVESGQSGTAFASILSGGDVADHGVHAQAEPIAAEALVISEAFDANGYETFVWAEQEAARLALDGRGIAPQNRFEGMLTGTDETFGHIVARLATDPTYKALLISMFSQARAPEGQPDRVEVFCSEYPGQCELAALFGAGLIERAGAYRLDIETGRIVDAVDEAGLRDESLIVIAAAHGSVLPGQDLPFDRASELELAPPVLNVPLILWAPGLGVRQGRYQQVTRAMDIFPTVAELAGLELPARATLSGVSLAAAVLDQGPEPVLVARSHTGPASGQSIGLTSRDLVFRYSDSLDGASRFEVFDRAHDALETIDIYDAENPLHRRMLIESKAYRAEIVADYLTRPTAGRRRSEMSVEGRPEAPGGPGPVN